GGYGIGFEGDVSVVEVLVGFFDLVDGSEGFGGGGYGLVVVGEILEGGGVGIFADGGKGGAGVAVLAHVDGAVEFHGVDALEPSLQGVGIVYALHLVGTQLGAGQGAVQSWDIEAELKTISMVSQEKTDFSLAAGMWKDYTIDTNEIRVQAWKRNK
ncbi:unnamed protein product, partial [Rotaria socialis]